MVEDVMKKLLKAPSQTVGQELKSNSAYPVDRFIVLLIDCDCVLYLAALMHLAVN
jgi:hypothetical protein